MKPKQHRSFKIKNYPRSTFRDGRSQISRGKEIFLRDALFATFLLLVLPSRDWYQPCNRMCHSRMSTNAFVIKSIRLFDFFIGNFFRRFMSNRKVLQALNVVQLSSVKFWGRKCKQLMSCRKENSWEKAIRNGSWSWLTEDDTFFVEFRRKMKKCLQFWEVNSF